MKYHVKITDNETGEIIEDCDFLCMFGAIGKENCVAQCALSHNALNIQTAVTLHAANKVLEMVVTKSGNLMLELIKEIERAERKQNNEEQ